MMTSSEGTTSTSFTDGLQRYRKCSKHGRHGTFTVALARLVLGTSRTPGPWSEVASPAHDHCLTDLRRSSRADPCQRGIALEVIELSHTTTTTLNEERGGRVLGSRVAVGSDRLSRADLIP
mmetsp:Transcript_7728/g.13982  ORF Transcript_7728/g.13982 Transcript_7728/m.13982 type:complete len:121 (-) Transcript_7728:32-394(-)